MGKHVLVTTLIFIMPLVNNSEAADYLRAKCLLPISKLSARNGSDLTKLQEHTKFSGKCVGEAKRPAYPWQQSHWLSTQFVSLSKLQIYKGLMESVLLHLQHHLWFTIVTKHHHRRSKSDKQGHIPYSPVMENKGLSRPNACSFHFYKVLIFRTRH